MTRCTARRHNSKTGKRQRCLRDAIEGGTVCESHGGRAPQVVHAAEVRQLGRALDAFVQPISLDHEAADPAHGLYLEYRQTYARVEWLQAEIARTLNSESLHYGKTKEEHIAATEFPGVNVTFEPRIPVLYDLLARERSHLLRIEELMSKNHFKQAELALREGLYEKSGRYTYAILANGLSELGHDIYTPEVQAAMNRVFERERERLRLEVGEEQQ